MKNFWLLVLGLMMAGLGTAAPDPHGVPYFMLALVIGIVVVIRGISRP